MEFKMKKDNTFGGMMAVAQDEEKRVLIRKNNGRFFITEFAYDANMSRIMESPYYNVHGEIVADHKLTRRDTYPSLIEDYNAAIGA